MRKIYVFLLLALMLNEGKVNAQKLTWPKEIPLSKTGGKVIIYQPQPDELTGNTLTGRAAIAGKEKAGDELIFGAIFFEAKLMTDKATRKGRLESLKITNAKVSGIDDQEKIKKLIALIESEVPKWNIEISLDQLASTIKKQHPDAEIYNNTPPKIIYKDKPTTLVILDGEPKIQQDKNLEAEKVVNSPGLIFKEGAQWNMYNGGIWYKSAAVLSGWTKSSGMSKKVKSINDQIKKQEKENNDNKEVKEKPEATDILVSTEPAELIQTKGVPVYKIIDSTSLQYISNSTNDIFKDASGQLYILIAGRWYKSASLNGPWVFNEPDKLPADFAKIPEGSDKDNVLVSVAGTDAAEEAIIDAEIPQTAKVDRKTATVKVEYDGEPKFESIEGCSLQLGINSNLTVLKEASGKYFALDNGVWFVGDNAKGPWKVADVRPADIEKIPSKSAAYNAKFVQVYEATPEYVIVGYTAGYLGSYVQGDPVIVFGTGFYYRPWYGSIYYPRPTTWGFGFSYNPWTGWSMGTGFNVGFLHIGFNFGGGYGGGWFGPAMYRPPYRPVFVGGGYYGRRPGRGGNTIIINNNHNNIYRPNNRPGNNNRPGIAGNSRPGNNGIGSNYRPGNNNHPGNNNGIGGNNNNRPGLGGNNNNNRPGIGGNNINNRPGNNTGIGNNNSRDAKPSKQPDNVFADRDGNVFQKDKQGNINQRDNKTKSWNKPQTPAANNGISRDVQSRERGNQRQNNFNNAAKPAYQGRQPRAAAPANLPGAGGGGKRRGR